MDKLDLRWGNPAFLHDFNSLLETGRIRKFSDSYGGGLSELKSAIIKLHTKVRNSKVDNRYIIIGNGATQLLMGLIHILGRPVYARKPFFSRIPLLTKLAGQEFLINPFTKSTFTHIVTTPNNPDNRIMPQNALRADNSNVVLDCVYNWPIYTDPIEYDADITIFNASKAFGLAASRVGWALIKDPEIAKKLEEYIEHTTAGVSVEAQSRVLSVIEQVIQSPDEHFFFTSARIVLKKRWAILRHIQAKYKLSFKFVNDSGMFALCEGTCPEEIIPLDGPSMGLNASSFRLNIGCTDEEFRKLIQCLQQSK